MPDISVAHYMLSELLQETYEFFISGQLVRNKTMYQMT